MGLRKVEGCRLHNLYSMGVDSKQHTHRGACAGWGRSRECSHQSDAQRRLRAEIRSSVRARCRLPRVARVSLSLRCARAPFGQRVREARIEGGCASRRTLRMPLFRYQGSSRAGGKESSPTKGCFHTPKTPDRRTGVIRVSVCLLCVPAPPGVFLPVHDMGANSTPLEGRPPSRATAAGGKEKTCWPRARRSASVWPRATRGAIPAATASTWMRFWTVVGRRRERRCCFASHPTCHFLLRTVASTSMMAVLTGARRTTSSCSATTATMVSKSSGSHTARPNGPSALQL